MWLQRCLVVTSFPCFVESHVAFQYFSTHSNSCHWNGYASFMPRIANGDIRKSWLICLKSWQSWSELPRQQFQKQSKFDSDNCSGQILCRKTSSWMQRMQPFKFKKLHCIINHHIPNLTNIINTDKKKEACSRLQLTFLLLIHFYYSRSSRPVSA